MGRKFLFAITIISALLIGGCLASEREFSSPYGFSLKYPSRWTIKETKKDDAYFVGLGDRREDRTGLSFYFYPASTDEIHYSCEALGEEEKLYAGELIACETVDINGHKYIQADVARNYGRANQYISFILTTNIEDNFLKILSGYYKKDDGEREKIKKILQSLSIDDRASKPLLSEKFIEIQDSPQNFLVRYRIPKHPESPYINNHLLKLIDPSQKTSTLLPLKHFNGDFAYLLPTNEILYTSSPYADGKGGGGDFRLYSLDTETDKFVVGAQSYGSFLVEKFDKNLGQIQLLTGYSDGESAERFLLDLHTKKLMKVEKGSLGFFECIEDPDGTCGAAADKSLQKWKKFLAIGGLDQEAFLQIATDENGNKMNQYTAPSCKNYSDILREVETPTAEIIGCIN